MACSINISNYVSDIMDSMDSIKDSDSPSQVIYNFSKEYVKKFKTELIDPSDIQTRTEFKEMLMDMFIEDVGFNPEQSAMMADSISSNVMSRFVPRHNPSSTFEVKENETGQVFDPNEKMFRDDMDIDFSFLNETEVEENSSEEYSDPDAPLVDETDNVIPGNETTTKSKTEEKAPEGLSRIEKKEWYVNRDKTSKLEKKREKLRAMRSPSAKLTWEKVVRNVFPGNASAAIDTMNEFRQELFHSIIIDKSGVPILPSMIPDNILKAKEDMLKEANNLKSGLGVLYNLKWGELSQVLSNPGDYPSEIASYKAYIKAKLFDVMLTSNKVLGDTIKFDAETGKYVYAENKAQGEVRHGWENEVMADAFAGGSKISDLILRSTPLVQPSADMTGVENIYDKMNPTFVAQNKSFTRASAASTSVQYKINMSHPDIDDIRASFRMNFSKGVKDPYMLGLYNRFYAEDPYTVKTVNGESVEMRSLYSVWQDPSVDENVRKRAHDMLVEFTSQISQVERYYWVDTDADGVVEILESVSPDVGAITESFNFFAKTYEPNAKLQYNPQTEKIEIGDFTFKAIKDDKGKIVSFEPTQELRARDYDSILKFRLKFYTGFGFSDQIISKFPKDGKKILNDIVSRSIVGAHLNKEGAEDFSILGISEEKINKNKKSDLKVSMYDILGHRNMSILESAVSDFLETDKTPMVKNSKGNRMAAHSKASPLYRLKRDIRKLKSTLVDENSTSPELLQNMDFSPLHSNGLVTDEIQLDNMYLKNKIGDKSHADLDDEGSMRLNMNLYFQQAQKTNFERSLFDFIVPSDKRKYPVASVRFQNREIMPNVYGSADEFGMVTDYYNTVSKTVQEYGRDMVASWSAELFFLRDQSKNDVYKKAIESIEEVIGKDAFKNQPESRKRDLLRSYFIRPGNIKMENIGKTFEGLRKMIDEANITIDELTSSRLYNNRDYVILKEKDGTKRVSLNNGLIHYIKEHSTRNNTEARLKRVFLEFIEDITENMGITKIDYAQRKIISDRFEGDKNEEARIWMDGAIKKEINGKIVYNPGIVSFFYQHGTVKNTLMQAAQGLVFDYDAKGADMTDPADIETKSWVSQIKRNAVALSDYHQPITQKVNDDFTPTEATRRLGSKSRVAFFDDVEVELDLLHDGGSKKQEVYDGAIMVHPLELLKYQHSYGDDFSALTSQILKTVMTNKDLQRGVTQPIKMAAHQMTSEMAINSRNNNKFDVWKMLEKSLKVDFPGGPKTIVYQSPYDPDVMISGVYKNMHEVFQDLGKEGPAGKSGFYNENVWKDLLEIEYENPATANQYVSHIVFNTSVKSGRTSTNPPLNSFLEKDNDFILSTLDQSLMGIQLNPKHDPEETADAVSAPTQVISSAMNEGRSYKDVLNILNALENLGEYNKSKLRELYEGEDLIQAAKDELIKSARRDDDYSMIKLLENPDQNYNDPRLDKKVNSKNSSLFEKLAIRLKFGGGSFVIHPVSNIQMVYEVTEEDESGNKRQIPMLRQDFERWAQDNGMSPDLTANELNSGDYPVKVRNLKWNEYIMGKGTSLLLHQSDEDFNKYLGKDEVKADKAFEISQEDTIREVTEKDIESIESGELDNMVLTSRTVKELNATKKGKELIQKLRDKGFYYQEEVSEVPAQGILSPKNLFTVKPTAAPDKKKAPAKASIATKFIGFGNRSTGMYAQQAGMYANTGNYTSDDVVFSSINGMVTNDNLAKTIAEVQVALEAGATVLTDSKEYTANSRYNQGEKKLQAWMESSGYIYNEVTVNGEVIGSWSKEAAEDTGNEATEKVTSGQWKKVSAEGHNIKETDVYNDLRKNVKNKNSQEYQDALKRYHRVLNDEQSSITSKPGEVLLPNTLKSKYGLRRGDNLSSIYHDSNYFVNQWKNNLQDKHSYIYSEYKTEVEAAGKDFDFSEFYLRVWENEYMKKNDMSQESFDIWKASKLKRVQEKGEDGKTFTPKAALEKYIQRSKEQMQHHINRQIKRHNDFKRSMEGVISRIPASGKQSSNSFVVVGFIEATENAVGIPAESMIVKGEDLDIDKGYAIMRDQDDQGFIFDYFTDKGMNNPEGKLLSIEEIKNNPEFKDKFLSMEQKYMNSRYDWYEKGANNYIIDNLDRVLRNSKNMVEANDPVSTETTGSYKKGDARFSVNSPSSDVRMGTINKVGVQMVGVEASASKAASITSFSFQKRNLERVNKLAPKFPGVSEEYASKQYDMVLSLIENEDTSYSHEKAVMESIYKREFGNKPATGEEILQEGRPLFVKEYMKFRKAVEVEGNFKEHKDQFYSYLHSSYNPELLQSNYNFIWNGRVHSTSTVANVDNLYALEQLLNTSEDKESLQGAIDSLRDKRIISEHSWSNYSELINASTDNAKELILGDINVNTVTGNDVSTMITLGVPMKTILDFFTSKQVRRLTEMAQKEDFSQPLSKMVGRLKKKIPKNEVKQYEEVVKALENLRPFSEEFRAIAQISSINQGIKNDHESLFKLIHKINNFLKKNGIQKPDILEFAKTGDEKMIDSLGTPFNLLRVLKDNPHFMAYLRTIAESVETRDKEIFTFKLIEDIVGSDEVLDKKDSLSEDEYSALYNGVHAFVTNSYLSTLGKVEFNDRAFDFSLPGSRIEFVQQMNKKIMDMKSEYPDNGFFEYITLDSKDHPMTGQKIQYIKVPMGTRVGNSDVATIVEGGLNSLPLKLRQQLYYYSLIMSTNGMYTDSFRNLFESRMDEGLNKFRSEFHNKLNGSRLKRGDIVREIKELTIDNSPAFYREMRYNDMGHPELYQTYSEGLEAKLTGLLGEDDTVKRVKYYDPVLKRYIFTKVEAKKVITQNTDEDGEFDPENPPKEEIVIAVDNVNFSVVTGRAISPFSMNAEYTPVFKNAESQGEDQYGEEVVGGTFKEALMEEYRRVGAFPDEAPDGTVIEPTLKIPKPRVPKGIKTNQYQIEFFKLFEQVARHEKVTEEQVENLMRKGLIKFEGDCF